MIDGLSPQWWTVPEALAWLGFGQSRAVQIVRRGSDLAREAGGNPENPGLLELPRGVKTPCTPEGMLGGRFGDMIDGPRTLAGWCREKHLQAEGRLNGSGRIEPIPVEDWRDGKLEWRVPTVDVGRFRRARQMVQEFLSKLSVRNPAARNNSRDDAAGKAIPGAVAGWPGPSGGQDYDQIRLVLVIPGGKVWGDLHFCRDQLQSLWHGLETVTFHSYSNQEEAGTAEARIWPVTPGPTTHGQSDENTREPAEAAGADEPRWSGGSAARGIMGRPEGTGIDDRRCLWIIRRRIEQKECSKSAAITWLFERIRLNNKAQMETNRSRLLRKLREDKER